LPLVEGVTATRADDGHIYFSLGKKGQHHYQISLASSQTQRRSTTVNEMRRGSTSC
jgi:hypothetical protein